LRHGSCNGLEGAFQNEWLLFTLITAGDPMDEIEMTAEQEYLKKCVFAPG